MAPSRDSVVSRTAPGAMATGPPTREPPHLPASLAGRSPEKLPRLVREVSAEVVGFFVYDVKEFVLHLRNSSHQVSAMWLVAANAT